RLGDRNTSTLPSSSSYLMAPPSTRPDGKSSFANSAGTSASRRDDDPLLHAAAAHRDERLGPRGRRELLDLHPVRSPDPFAPNEAGDRLAVHEDRGIAQHLPALHAAQRPYTVAQRAGECGWGRRSHPIATSP